MIKRLQICHLDVELISSVFIVFNTKNKIRVPNPFYLPIEEVIKANPQSISSGSRSFKNKEINPIVGMIDKVHVGKKNLPTIFVVQLLLLVYQIL